MKDKNKLMQKSDTAKEINPPRIKIDQSMVSSDWIASKELPNKTADNVGIDKRKENVPVNPAKYKLTSTSSLKSHIVSNC